MPRVMLIKPFSYSDVISPPLGLGYLAAALDGTVQVAIVDGVRERLNSTGLVKRIKAFQPDLVGLSIVSAAAAKVLDDIVAIRRALPGVVIVAGGPHPSLLPAEFYDAAAGAVDYILRGDAEFSFRELVDRCWNRRVHEVFSREIADIPGIWARTRDGMVTSEIPVDRECDNRGMPAWRLIPPGGYPRAPQGVFFREFPVAPVITSRGCPFECGFCSVAALKGKDLRFRSPELITAEIRLLQERFGVREIQFIDDNFTMSRQHVLSVCEAMLAENLALPWTCPNGVRIDALDDDILEAMKAAGCYSVSVGLETADPSLLARMNKHLDLDRAVEAIDRVVRKKMEVNAFFVLGYPGDSRKSIEATIRLAGRLPLTRAHFMLFTPFPGCREYDRLTGPAGETAGSSFRYDTTYAEVSCVPEGMTARELKRLHRRAFLKFYGRPAAAWRLLPALNSPSGLYYFLRRAAHWLG
ncbi:MAG: B12-binding domain-containing radical SAM protein [Desulfosudaceae bacterium]